MAPIQVRYFKHNYRWLRGTEAEYLNLLPESQLNEVRQFKHFNGFFNALAGKLLLRNAFLETGEPLEKWADLRTGEHGKPYHPDLFEFNVTHTDGLVAIAWSYDLAVGLDSERLRKKDPFLFTKQFNIAEMEGFKNSEDPVKAFFRRWTQKEAIVKEIGDGLTLPLREITESEPGVFHFHDDSWTTIPIDVQSAEHFVHLAVRGPHRAVEAQSIEF